MSTTVRPAASAPATLSAPQLREIERRLLEERTRSLRSLARLGLVATDRGDGASDSLMPLHMADRGTATMQETLDAALASRESHTLAEIDAALRRLYQSPARFGLDELTGAPIAFERLDILPWTRRSTGRD